MNNVNADTLCICLFAEASYKGTDGNGNTIRRGDTVEILDSEEIVQRLQGRMWQDRLRALLGKTGGIEYFDGDGDVWVSVPGLSAACFKPNTLFLASAGKASLINVCHEV